MKHTTLLLPLFAMSTMTALADDIQFTHADWRVTFVEKNHAFRIQSTTDGGATYSPVVTNCIPEASYRAASADVRTLSAATLTDVSYTTAPLSDDQFGTGTCHTFTFSAADEAVHLVERFYAYDDCPFLLVDLTLDALPQTGGQIASNYLAPISTTTSYRYLTASQNNRMLKVPFDNDGFTRYHRYKMNTSMTSYEVTAIYSGDDRHGVVIGSIDHNHWKSAIDVKGESNSNIARLRAYCGASNSETRDLLPHGFVSGSTVSSARFILDAVSDWRDGMERFAWANTRVAPKCETWTDGTPMGWQSWGVLAEKSNYTDVSEIAQYYADVLQPGGFCNDQGKVILSLDASDGLNDTQRKQLCTLGATRGQVFGCYSTPFSLWWDDASLDRYTATIGGKTYHYRDAVIKVNGKSYQYDGAYALDPTHPITKQSIVDFVNGAAAKGVRYIKCDFVNAGIIQADSYYKEGITTAVEAYNEGMRYLADRARAKGIFVALSIAPLFPYQYANSRRVACDTWGSIGHSEYAMNAMSGGWWTSGLYQYNDPDHVVLIGTNEQLYNTEGENRARFTTGCVTGMVLVADNFSTSNVSKRGNPSLSKSRAAKVMLNPDVNAIARLGVSFRPLYGCKEDQSREDHAENFHIYRTADYLYIAGINYGSTTALKGSIALSDLGLSLEECGEVKELWTSSLLSLDSSLLTYDIPAKDARIYRIALKNQEAEGIATVYNDADADASRNATAATYDLQGRPSTPAAKGIIITNKRKTVKQ